LPVPHSPPEIGIPAGATIPSMQTEFFKELINKFAWVLGSSYRVPYNRVKEEPRITAIDLAKSAVATFGYGEHLRK